MATSGHGQSQEHEQTPEAILARVYQRAASNLTIPVVPDAEIRSQLEVISRSKIGADVRVLMACLLAKIHQPAKDIRKPYAVLGPDAYSGRTYDEHSIAAFITEYSLPCNRTTGFLTPAFRTKNIVLSPEVNLGGESLELDTAFLAMITAVYDGVVSAEDALTEVVRNLLIVKRENDSEIQASLARLRGSEGLLALSAERIVTLIQQHLASTYTSRLPVLVVTAAYRAASTRLGERSLPLQGHNAADEQTGALGDVEITLISDERVVTSYEMKDKRVTKNDIDQALHKVERHWHDSQVRVDNYIFITTDTIDPDVQAYSAALYANTGGVEFVILNCIGFLRHFLHLFHRLRMRFLEEYQTLVLEEPETAVRHELKVLILALRRAAESELVDMPAPDGSE